MHPAFLKTPGFKSTDPWNRIRRLIWLMASALVSQCQPTPTCAEIAQHLQMNLITDLRAHPSLSQIELPADLVIKAEMITPHCNQEQVNRNREAILCYMNATNSRQRQSCHAAQKIFTQWFLGAMLKTSLYNHTQ